MNITIQELPEYEVAYVRHVGNCLKTYVAWEKLMQWAIKHELYPTHQHFIGISLDDPHMVDESAFRYDACVTLPAGFVKEDHPTMQFKHLPGGLYAHQYFDDSIEQLAHAYQHLFGHWLPNNGYEADDRPCLEFSLNNPADDPEGKCKVDLYIPIRKIA